MECHASPDSGIADGGALQFRMAFGSTSQDALLGLIDFHLHAFVPASTPLSGRTG
ncbi:MAG TPA: hypothetical protein VFZ65_13555 [Planctomycetota bacterium]|nr:hypothetical protein [Planctomycetota bacterium]